MMFAVSDDIKDIKRQRKLLRNLKKCNYITCTITITSVTPSMAPLSRTVSSVRVTASFT